MSLYYFLIWDSSSVFPCLFQHRNGKITGQLLRECPLVAPSLCARAGMTHTCCCVSRCIASGGMWRQRPVADSARFDYLVEVLSTPRSLCLCSHLSSRVPDPHSQGCKRGAGVIGYKWGSRECPCLRVTGPSPHRPAPRPRPNCLSGDTRRAGGHPPLFRGQRACGHPGVVTRRTCPGLHLWRR